MLRILIVYLVFSGQLFSLEMGGIVAQKVDSIDLYNSTRVAYRGDMITTVGKDGSLSIYKGLKLLKRFPPSEFDGLMNVDGVTGAYLYFASDRYLSIAPFIKVSFDNGSSIVDVYYRSAIYAINLQTFEKQKIVSYGETISAYGGLKVWSIGDRLLHDERFGFMVSIFGRQGAFSSSGIFRVVTDATGKNNFLPVSTNNLTSSPYGGDAYLTIGNELLQVFRVNNSARDDVFVQAVRLDNGIKRSIDGTPRGCYFLDKQPGNDNLIIACGSAGNKTFFKKTSSGDVRIAMSGILPRSASQPRSGVSFSAFVGSSTTYNEDYTIAIQSGEMLCLIDELNQRAPCSNIGTVNSEIAIIGNKVLVGTPNGTYALSPTLITDVSFTSGVISGKGVNVSLPGYKTEVLVNGIPVKGSTVTETTFRAVPEVPPSGAGEVSLRLTSLSDGVIANSINIARIFSPVTNVPKVTRITTMDRITGKQIMVTPVEINGEMIPEISPNMAISFHGTNLAGGLPVPLDSASTFPLPTRLNSLEVRLDRTQLLRLYVANTRQVDTVIPPDITPGPHTLEFIRYDTAEVPNVEARIELKIIVTRSKPVFRTVDLPQGWNTLEAYRPLKEGEVTPGIVTPDNPLSAGEIITAQGTGFGETLNPIPYGDITPNTEILQEVKVFVNGQESKIIYAGTSTWPGVFQISFEVPPSLYPDERGLFWIVFQFGGKEQAPFFSLNGNPKE